MVFSIATHILMTTSVMSSVVLYILFGLSIIILSVVMLNVVALSFPGSVYENSNNYYIKPCMKNSKK
jgi:hypothetical protein